MGIDDFLIQLVKYWTQLLRMVRADRTDDFYLTFTSTGANKQRCSLCFFNCSIKSRYCCQLIFSFLLLFYAMQLDQSIFHILFLFYAIHTYSNLLCNAWCVLQHRQDLLLLRYNLLFSYIYAQLSLQAIIVLYCLWRYSNKQKAVIIQQMSDTNESKNRELKSKLLLSSMCSNGSYAGLFW